MWRESERERDFEPSFLKAIQFPMEPECNITGCMQSADCLHTAVVRIVI